MKFVQKTILCLRTANEDLQDLNNFFMTEAESKDLLVSICRSLGEENDHRKYCFMFNKETNQTNTAFWIVGILRVKKISQLKFKHQILTNNAKDLIVHLGNLAGLNKGIFKYLSQCSTKKHYLACTTFSHLVGCAIYMRDNGTESPYVRPNHITPNDESRNIVPSHSYMSLSGPVLQTELSHARAALSQMYLDGAVLQTALSHGRVPSSQNIYVSHTAASNTSHVIPLRVEDTAQSTAQSTSDVYETMRAVREDYDSSFTRNTATALYANTETRDFNTASNTSSVIPELRVEDTAQSTAQSISHVYETMHAVRGEDYDSSFTGNTATALYANTETRDFNTASNTSTGIPELRVNNCIIQSDESLTSTGIPELRVNNCIVQSDESLSEDEYSTDFNTATALAQDQDCSMNNQPWWIVPTQ